MFKCSNVYSIVGICMCIVYDEKPVELLSKCKCHIASVYLEVIHCYTKLIHTPHKVKSILLICITI